jgi:hypothetical protein
MHKLTKKSKEIITGHQKPGIFFQKLLFQLICGIETSEKEKTASFS